MTAGHCAYDWSHDLGCLREIKACIGYAGRESIADGSVRFRMGKKVATTLGWLCRNKTRVNDVGFVKLSEPFTGITPFKYAETPKQVLRFLVFLGILVTRGISLRRRKSAYMFEMFQPTDFDLNKTGSNKMLEYRISTYPVKH